MYRIHVLRHAEDGQILSENWGFVLSGNPEIREFIEAEIRGFGGFQEIRESKK